MLKLDEKTLLSVISQKKDWVTSTYLSEIFNLSRRTIRNYVSKINAKNTQVLIESSNKGYRVNSNAASLLKISGDERIETPLARVNFILRKLINSKNAVDFFDLAEELYISESTLSKDIKQVKKLIKDFSLKMTRKGNIISIEGNERNKRKLIYHLLSLENKNDFIAFTSTGIVVEQDQPTILQDKISHIFHENDLFLNDFGLNNLIVHLLVIIDRIRKGKQISESVSLDKVNGSKDYQVAVVVKKFIESMYNIEISDNELYYLALIIASNSNPLDYSLVTSENIQDYINDSYIKTCRKAIKHLEQTYYLEPFDDSFMVNFTIHISNMIQRAKNSIYVKNPLTLETKTTYPFIYDMAVFVANEIRDGEKIFINEDEITFIAFHIGTYLENNKNNTEKVNCVFVYADYHDMHLPTLTQIRHTFKDDLTILEIIPVKEIPNTVIECDMVISTVDAVIDTSARVVRINFFPSQSNIELLRDEISTIKQKRKKQAIIENIQRFIGRKIFKKEFYTDDEFEMINILSNECYQLGLCKASFKNEVLERESLSPTSFNNFVAVPHSLKHNAIQSFMSVVINEKSMKWGDNSVNIIILIGISKKDRAAFREIFDDLIAILSEPIYVNQLIKCQDYDGFIDTLTLLITKQNNSPL